MRVDAQPVHQADAEGVAQRATQDHDRGVVPEERDHGEEQAEPEPDDPRQDRREEALAEDLLAPLRARGQAEQERPQGQQDREELEAIGRPGAPITTASRPTMMPSMDIRTLRFGLPPLGTCG